MSRTIRRRTALLASAAAAATLASTTPFAQAKHYRLAYDQPIRTGYGINNSIREVAKLEEIKDMKGRVQATPTEDTMFPAYGAQIVHMPFGNVYTSLQTGVVDAAENGVNVFLVNKHYEVAPVMSMTEHEANNNLLWISDKLWSSLTAEQKGWVQAAADEVAKVEPGKALDLERQSATKLKGMGV